MWYVEGKKEAHVFDGTVTYNLATAATWVMLGVVELIP